MKYKSDGQSFSCKILTCILRKRSKNLSGQELHLLEVAACILRVGIATLDAFFSHRTLCFSSEQEFSGFVLFNASLTKNNGNDSVCTEFPWYFINIINLEIGRKC